MYSSRSSSTSPGARTDGNSQSLSPACWRRDLEIAVERLDDGRMQRHEPALAELGLADVQDAVGPYIVEPERERLGDAQSRGGDQPEQHDVELATQGIGLLTPELAGGIEDAGDLVRRVDIGDRPRLPASREVGARDLMPRIFGMQEAREQDQVRQAPLRERPASGRLSPARRERMRRGYAFRPAPAAKRAKARRCRAALTSL